MSLSAGGAGYAPQQVYAQVPSSGNAASGNSIVGISGKNMRFQAVIAELCKQTGYNIVADGEPTQDVTDIAVQGSAEEALNAIATVFDYTWTRSKSGIILLNRRFHKPGEYPQANLRELYQMTEDVLPILAPFRLTPEKANPGRMLDALKQTLTPRQIEEMKSGEIRMSELRQEQAALVQQAIAAQLFGNVPEKWEAFRQQLKAFPTASLRLKRSEVFSPTVAPAASAKQSRSYVDILYRYILSGDGSREDDLLSTPYVREK